MNDKLTKHLDTIFSSCEDVRAVRKFKEELHKLTGMDFSQSDLRDSDFKTASSRTY
ncbi:MAG TPA: hypothetical protein VM577_00540 [Anaerovoracaceae bacterium]|nr:hypothetical protein [Anaerovoracaceae bacterium]